MIDREAQMRESIRLIADVERDPAIKRWLIDLLEGEYMNLDAAVNPPSVSPTSGETPEPRAGL